MRRVSHALICAICLLCIPGALSARKSQPHLTWSLAGSLGFVYDDNLIGLSERDRNLYLHDAAGIPTPLESLDDLETQIQLQPSVRWRAPYDLYASAEYRLKLVKRIGNGFTDYQTHSVALSCRPRGGDYRWSIRYRALLIPSFYLRVYRDADFGEYHSTRYRQLDHALTARWRLSTDLWLEGDAGGGSYYYNSKFTEYDSDYFNIGAGLAYSWREKSSISGRYARRISDNVGAAQVGIAPGSGLSEDTEYGDADYNEDDFQIGLKFPLAGKRAGNLAGGFQFRHRRRVYTTDRSLESDPFHRSRLDRRTQFTFSISSDIAKRLNVESYVTYDERDSVSDAPQLELAKDFVRHEYGLIFTYDIK